MRSAPQGELDSVQLYRQCAGFFKRDAVTKSCMGPEGEALWATMLARPGFKPFSKLMYDKDERGYRPVQGYVSGDEAVEKRGIDLRFGWDPSGDRLKGVCGFGEGACWALGFRDGNGQLGVHGGVFHTVLDEITGEAAKYSKVPRILTSTASIKLLHPLHVGEHCEVEAKVTKQQSMRIFVEGRMFRGSTQIASGEFVIGEEIGAFSSVF